MQSSRASPVVSVEAIEHVLLLVNGLERALSFYEGVLGARVESRFPKYAMVELRVGVSRIDLVDTSVAGGRWALPPVAGGRNVDHIGLRVAAPDTEAVRRRLADCGVEIVEERSEEQAGRVSHSFYVCDPSGNVLELMTIPVA